MIHTARLCLAASVTAAVLAGCGSGPFARPGMNMHDPRAVARAYATAEYRCGNEGAGARYDLSITTSPTPRGTRAEYVQWERTHGCQPEPMPQLLVTCGPTDGDIAVVEIDAGTTSAVMTMRRLADKTWRVDTYHSDTAALAS